MSELKTSTEISRSFRDLSNEEVADIEKASSLASIGWTGGFGWDELLLSKRVLIVSEAGSGKTFECQARQLELWKSGQAAFFLDLATLARSSVPDMLTEPEEKRFGEWLRSQSETATFFLDSFDELKLTLGKFDQALIRLAKALDGQLGRARIVITTRPVSIDRELIVRHLPVPVPGEAEPTAEAFADMIMDRKKNAAKEDGPKVWRNVGLMPLSNDQKREFARLQGVPDPDALLDDIRLRDAEQFAERPQDLLELCSDWREHQRIRTHREQVETNVATKLKPSVDRQERSALSQVTAVDGASRLALAALLTRKLTLRHGADSDKVPASEAALDVSKVLPDWDAPDRATLLERPLFGFACYGRVRFHHRSVLEFLAAKRLDALIGQGIPIKSVKRLIFTDTEPGFRTVRPSMRPVAAWLALSRDTIFDEILALDPAVVLDHGDPQSLRPAQRVRALQAYVERYGRGGWRGLSTPHIQVHRFASQELTVTVSLLWDQGIENPEVRALLLRLVAAGKLRNCADLAYAAAMDLGRDNHERLLAIEALQQLGDTRLSSISASVENDAHRWPEAIARRLVLELFPAHLPVNRLSQILKRVKEKPRSVGDLTYRWPREIEAAPLSDQYLDGLRQALMDLIMEDIAWERDKFPHLRTKRPDLLAALIAVCRRQAGEAVQTERWIDSSMLAIRLSKQDQQDNAELQELRIALDALPPETRERAFWKEDAFLARLHQPRDAWHRVFDRTRYGGIRLDQERDAAWVRRRLSDPNEPLDHREMMLQTEMLLFNLHVPDRRVFVEGLKQFVDDAPGLKTVIENNLKPQTVSAELRRMEAANQRHAKQAERRGAKALASWIGFWREIEKHPGAVFAPERAQNTAWNLWQALERSGQESRASGWNRRFIEDQFGRGIADRLRETMMTAWREDEPTLRSERPPDQRNTFLVRWQFGLAGIYAEAEDDRWVDRLTEKEAELASRYAPLELNGFPSWLERLIAKYPAAVDRILGNELSVSLRDAASEGTYSMFLQNVSYAPPKVASLFIPRIRAWLSEVATSDMRPNEPQAGQNLRQAIALLVRLGSDEDRRFVEATAKGRLADGIAVSYPDIWLHALLHLNEPAGVDALEQGLSTSSASKYGSGVQIFAQLFSRDHGGLGLDLNGSGFSPSLLLRLLRLSHLHIRVEEDAQHEGSYSPDARDNAERSRSTIFGVLLATKGLDGWRAKLELAADPLFADLKDRAIALARERAAEEADDLAISEAEFAILDSTGETPPATREAMFSIMRDRLDDVDDLLLEDISPRELWSHITDERLMRRELARVLRNAARQSYTIDQESVTGDENETDIRFRSTGSKQQGTIELKLGDDRSGRDLFNTVRDQLLTKYMAPDECRAGCLLVTIAHDRQWEHPKTGTLIGFEELMDVLNKEADRLAAELGGTVSLMAKGLDLRPRLRTEKKNGTAPR